MRLILMGLWVFPPSQRMIHPYGIVLALPSLFLRPRLRRRLLLSSFLARRLVQEDIVIPALSPPVFTPDAAQILLSRCLRPRRCDDSPPLSFDDVMSSGGLKFSVLPFSKQPGSGNAHRPFHPGFSFPLFPPRLNRTLIHYYSDLYFSPSTAWMTICILTAIGSVEPLPSSLP